MSQSANEKEFDLDRENQGMFPWGSDTRTDKQELSVFEVMVVSILDERKKLRRSVVPEVEAEAVLESKG